MSILGYKIEVAHFFIGGWGFVITYPDNERMICLPGMYEPMSIAAAVIGGILLLNILAWVFAYFGIII